MVQEWLPGLDTRLPPDRAMPGLSAPGADLCLLESQQPKRSASGACGGSGRRVADTGCLAGRSDLRQPGLASGLWASWRLAVDAQATATKAALVEDRYVRVPQREHRIAASENHSSELLESLSGE